MVNYTFMAVTFGEADADSTSDSESVESSSVCLVISLILSGTVVSTFVVVLTSDLTCKSLN